MQVSLTPNLYQSNTYKYNNFQTKNYARPQKNNPTFKHVSPADVIFPGITAGIMRGIPIFQKYRSLKRVEKNFINPLYVRINNPEKYQQELPTLLKMLLNNVEPIQQSMPQVRTDALYCFRNHIDDSVKENQAVKIALIESLINDGCYESSDFLDIYKALSDKYYKNFKESILEKCLHLPNLRALANENHLLYAQNYLMAQSLDINEHAEFLQTNKDYILLQKQLFNKNLISEFQSEKERNSAYEMYNIKPKSDDSFLNLFSNSVNNIVLAALCESEFKPEKLAQMLNMDLCYAEDIVNDYITEFLINKTENKEQKLDLYKQRIESKIKLPGFPEKIDDYIERTDFKTELTEYKKELETKKTTSNYDYDSSLLDDDWRWNHGLD